MMVKVTVRKVVQVLMATTIGATFCMLVYLHTIPSLDNMDENVADSRFDAASFARIDVRTRKKLHYSNYVSEYYASFNKTIDDQNAFAKKPLSERCETFFDHFIHHNPEFTYKRPMSSLFDKGVSKKSRFFDIELNRMRIENKGQPVERTDELNRAIKNKYDQRILETLEYTQQAADISTIMRAYGNCFINRDLTEKQGEMYNQMTEKLFPYFNGLVPVFEKANATGTQPLDGVPVYGDNGEVVKTIPKPEKSNLIDFLLKSSNGKGIAIVAANRHGRELIKLMRVLRATNNTLPIQILYRNDMTDRIKNSIIASATVPKEVLLDPNRSGSYISVYPELDLMEASKKYGSEFPVQSLTFVAYRDIISPSYRSSFRGYYSKILGLLLTSFKEVILMDADSIPFIDMKEFFELDDYVSSGAFFFRDRSLRDVNDFIETNYFASLFPTKNADSLDALLDIPAVTDKTLLNPYMSGWRHHQEAGIVVFNRLDHFRSIIMMLLLALSGDPTFLSIWGEKEMYWLGMAMAGDESYMFNKHAAASVGTLSKYEHTYYPKDPTIHEVCLSHPGHIYKDGRLLWINSGFSYCKKNGSSRDSKRFPLNILDEALVVNMYSSPAKLTHAVVPPDLPAIRHGQIDYKFEEEFIASWKQRPQDMDEVKDDVVRIEEHIPQKNWVKSQMCSGYYYCAYDQVEGYDHDGKRDRGVFFEFPQDRVQVYDFLGKVWMTGDARLY